MKYIKILSLAIITFVGVIIINGEQVNSESYIKGMTISCQTWGYEWATPEMKSAMMELHDLGINSIAIHPYARISENGEVRFRKIDDPIHITTPCNYAHELDMQMMIIPHLAYWGTQFKWRGDINFHTTAEWQRFFETYGTWMLNIAAVAESSKVDILCIGIEYSHAESFDTEWRRLIREIRGIYHGKLIYAANWDTYQKITFWEDLDYIGIQAYFPISNRVQPSEKDLVAGWRRIHMEMIPFLTKLNKKVIFTELGYNTSVLAAREPWSSVTSDSPEALSLQEKCLRVALQQNRNQDYLAGVFLWKWFPDLPSRHHHENFDLQRREIKNMIRNVWN